MIVENDCLILHILQMSDGETREEVPMDVMILQPAEREAKLLQANREELVERIARTIRADGTVQPLGGLHLARCSLPLKPVHSVLEPSVCDCSGQQGGPAGRESLPLRPLTVSARHRRAAPRQPGPRSFEGATLPQSAPGTCPHPRQFGHG